MKKLVLVFALFGGFALASQAQNAPAAATTTGKTEEKAACSSSAKKSCCANKSAKSCAGESKAEVAPSAPQMEKQ